MTLATPRSQEESESRTKASPRILLERPFFSQENVLKVMLNANGECYFQWGWKARDSWSWKKVKFNDAELGEILLVLEGRKEKAAFFHSYAGREGKTTTQIWINRSGGFCTFKVKECSKGLNEGEQRVLQQLLQHIIVMMNLSL